MDNSLFNQMRSQWRNFIEEPNIENYDIDILSKFPFLQHLESNDLAYAIVNSFTSELEYFSKNYFDILGIDIKDYEKQGPSSIIKHIAKFQDNHFDLSLKYFKEFWDATIPEERESIIRTAAGLTVEHKKKGLIKIIVRTHILQVNSLGAPLYQFLIYKDVTHMMKDDVYWLRFSKSDLSGKVLVYLDSVKEVLKDDILSLREKEILELIIKGKSTEEIANTLFISKITVNNHRQNMLNRVGAKDTTALISIAQLCQLV